MNPEIQCSTLFSERTSAGIFKVLNIPEVEGKEMASRYSQTHGIKAIYLDYFLKDVKKAFKKDKIKLGFDIYAHFKNEDRICIDDFFKLKKIDLTIKASDLYSPLYIHIFKLLYFLDQYDVFFIVSGGLSYESIDLLEEFICILISFEANRSKTFFLI